MRRTPLVNANLQLRKAIESGFLPLSCTCTSNPDGSLTVKVFEPLSGRVELLVTPVATEQLTSSRAISELIGELRNEITGRTKNFGYRIAYNSVPELSAHHWFYLLDLSTLVSHHLPLRLFFESQPAGFCRPQ